MVDRIENDNEHVPYVYYIAFLVISCGYMLPWTALGSLISYYKETYGVDFYVKIYCLYYLPGLPIAIFQYRYDEKYDAVYGSKKAYLWRGVIGFSLMLFVLLLMIGIQNEYFLLFGFLLLGIGGWLCHGTASMLAAMFPSSAVAYLQIGFRFPEIYSLAATYYLDLNSTASASDLQWFHALTAVMVFISMLCWIVLVRSRVSSVYFAAKDFKLRSYSLCSSIATTQETESLLHHTPSYNPITYSFPADASTFTGQDSAEDAYCGDDEESKSDFWRSRADDLLEWETERDTYYSQTPVVTPRCSNALCASCAAEAPVYAKSCNKNPLLTAVTLAGLDSLPSIPTISSTTSISKKPKTHNIPTTCTLSTASWTCGSLPLCAALVLTIWSSIFQAAFFAYVNSPRNQNIEQTLYFVRLFSDLLGRPLTFLPRPFFVQVRINNFLVCVKLLSWTLLY